MLTASVCAGLGVWQLRRLEQRRASNAALVAAQSLPAVELGPELPASLPTRRRVRATGSYDFEHQVVVRGQSLAGTPGVRVFTPLRIPGQDTAILVLRGFAPAPDAVSADLTGLDEPGEQVVSGAAFPVGRDSVQGKPIIRRGLITWQRLELAALERHLGMPLAPYFIWQTPAPGLPAMPRRLELAPLDDGPHLSYAVQWFAFGITALVVGGVLLTRRDQDSGAGIPPVEGARSR